MKTNEILIYQGTNDAWFIKLNGELICGSQSKEWIMKFAEKVKSEVGACTIKHKEKRKENTKIVSIMRG